MFKNTLPLASLILTILSSAVGATYFITRSLDKAHHELAQIRQVQNRVWTNQDQALFTAKSQHAFMVVGVPVTLPSVITVKQENSLIGQ
jgi:hypothetical protein